MSRPKEDQKHIIAKFYGLGRRRRMRLTPKLVEQLRLCKSEEARRLILGVSR